MNVSVGVTVRKNIYAQVVIQRRIIAGATVTPKRIYADVQINGIVYVSDMTSTYTAGENLGGHRVVMIEGGLAVYYDPSDENNTGKKLGFSKHAAVTGDTVTVIHIGNLELIGWGLNTDAVYYAATNGLITPVIPTTGIFQRVGVAVSANKILVDFSEPIVFDDDDSAPVELLYVEDDYVDSDYVD